MTGSPVGAGAFAAPAPRTIVLAVQLPCFFSLNCTRGRPMVYIPAAVSGGVVGPALILVVIGPLTAVLPCRGRAL